MEHSSKKQSWLEFINGTMGNNIKGEAVDRNTNETQTNNITYARTDSDNSFEKSNKTNNKQPQNLSINRKYKTLYI